MPYLIDGHNLIPKIPGLGLSDIDDEVQLIQMLQEFCRQQQKNADVYFDNAAVGQSGQQKAGRVTAHFVRQGRTADSAIKARLKQLGGAAHNWTVVSSDLEVVTSARYSGAQTMESAVFAKQLLARLETSSEANNNSLERNLSKEEVDEWLRVFQEGKPKRSK